MKKGILLLTVICALAMTLPVLPTLAGQAVPDKVEMNSSVYETHRKPIVTFTHKKHADDYGIACSDCHHVFEQGKNTWQQGDPVDGCDVCHSKDKPSPEERRSMSDAEKMKHFHYEAIHENCKGCHKTRKMEGKPTGPISCSKCHVK